MGTNSSATSAMRLIESLAQFVAFLAGDFEIEHQIFDVEPELSEGLLHEGQNSATAFDRLDHSAVDAFEISLLRVRQSGDRFREIDEFARQVVLAAVRESGFGGHSHDGSVSSE